MDENNKVKQEEQLLNQYLKELIEKQDHILLTEKDLNELNEKFPLSQEEKEKVIMLAQRHTHRAEQYKQQERWDTAIVETERALLFSPLDIELRLDLAELYILRSRQYGYLEKDLYRAGQKIKESITLEPRNKNAQRMEKEFQNLNRMLRGTDQNKKIIPLVIIVVLIMGAVLYPKIRDFNLWNRKEDAPLEIPQAADSSDWTEQEMQVIKTDSMEEKLNLDISRAVLCKNEEGYTVSLSGYAGTKTQTLKKLSLHLSIGDMLSPILEKDLILLDENSPELLPDETLPFSTDFHMTGYGAESSTVTLQIGEIEKSSVDPDPTQWSKLSPFWEIPRPDGLNLLFTARQSDFIEGYDRLYLKHDIKMENRSFSGISELKVTAKWYGRNEEELISKEINLVPPGNPPIRQESTQTFRVLLDLPKSIIDTPSTHSITITKIKKDE